MINEQVEGHTCGKKFSLNRSARLSMKDAKRRTDTCMRTPSTHENVCNSHHHSRMMIRRKKKRSRSKSNRRRGRKKEARERQRIDVRRAERTRRMRVFFFLEATKFCGLFEKKGRKKKRAEKEGARNIPPVS